MLEPSAEAERDSRTQIGVGKTELSKALASWLFGSQSALIRFDMSEYMEKYNVSKLVGSPPGYIGYDEGGQLTEKIRRKPYSVVLFDEIEKAHPDVFNILLQVLEDGILTDSQGRTVSFKNTVIIMTSNVGARHIGEPKNLGFTGGKPSAKNEEERIKKEVMGELKQTFKPEFLNRVDEMIVFHKLGEEEIGQIASNLLGQVAQRLEQMKIAISFEPEVVALVAKEGFDPRYGARPLRRVIQTKIEDLLADKMIGGELSAGDKVRCKQQDGSIILEKVL